MRLAVLPAWLLCFFGPKRTREATAETAMQRATVVVAGGHLVFGVRLSPMIAAAAMALSSLPVVNNANRLRRLSSPPIPALAADADRPALVQGGR